MSNRFKSIFFLIPLFFLIILTIKYYLSEKNIIYTNKSRTSYLFELSKNVESLPLLKNDTDNIIIYKSELDEFNSKRKKRIWETLINN